MEQFERIRRDRRDEGLSIRELARRHRVHRRTVRQALADAVPPARKAPVRTAPVLVPQASPRLSWGGPLNPATTQRERQTQRRRTDACHLPSRPTVAVPAVSSWRASVRPGTARPLDVPWPAVREGTGPGRAARHVPVRSGPCVADRGASPATTPSNRVDPRSPTRMRQQETVVLGIQLRSAAQQGAAERS